jgi:pimeloyl-ACP methyl ester carboxylesterase
LCGSFARTLAGDYTVVTYDPRGIGNSSPADTAEDVTPKHQADDVHCLLSALGGEPATSPAAAAEPSSGSR